MALQNGQDSEEHVKGVIRYLLTTLTASGTAVGVKPPCKDHGRRICWLPGGEKM